MSRSTGKGFSSLGLHGDVTSFECGHTVLAKRGPKRSPITRKIRQRKYPRRHSGTFVRRSTASLARDGGEGAWCSPSGGPEGTDGSDCDDALEDCIPVQPEEVFDLVDEQSASESEDQNDSDSDATIDSTGPSSGPQTVLSELPHSGEADSATARYERCTANQNARPSIMLQKQVIQPANVVDDATVQSTVVNRPVPMPPIVKPPQVAPSFSQEALLVFAPVDLTQWPIGHIPVTEQDPSVCVPSICEGPQVTTGDCIPPPCDLPGCDDWLCIDSSPAALACQLPKTGKLCPFQECEGYHANATPQACTTSPVSPPHLTEAEESRSEPVAPQCEIVMRTPMTVQSLPESPSGMPGSGPAPTLPQLTIVRAPQSLSLDQLEPRVCNSKACSVSAQTAVYCKLPAKQMAALNQDGCAPSSCDHTRLENSFIADVAAPDTCNTSAAVSRGTAERESCVIQPGTGVAACPESHSSDDVHQLPESVKAQAMSGLADSASPTLLPCDDFDGIQRSPQKTASVNEHDEPMHWFFSPLQESEVAGCHGSPAALVSPTQSCFGSLSRPNHKQASDTFVNASEVRCQAQALAEGTADGSSTRPALGGASGSPEALCHNEYPAAACRDTESTAYDGLRLSDQASPALELEDDDLYRMCVLQPGLLTCNVTIEINGSGLGSLRKMYRMHYHLLEAQYQFAMTCTSSPGKEESAVPALFMDLLLNDEDEDDLDWLDAEAPNTTVLPDTPCQMSPDGPHAHTRLRQLGQGQTPPHSPEQRCPGFLMHSRSSAEEFDTEVATSSRPAKAPNSSCLPCNEALTPAWTAHGVHESEYASASVLEPLQQPKFSHSQLRQLYAQVQAHAQLLLQSFLLASQGEISITATRDVEKLWGWSNCLLKAGPLREEQDAVASDTWEMMTDLMNLDRELSASHPENSVPAQLLGAVTPDDCQRDPVRMVKELDDGWRPVLLQASAPSIVHVPWLSHLHALVHACGIRMKLLPEGRAVLAQVSCDTFNQACTSATLASKTGTFMQPLNDDPDAAPGCRRNMRAFRSSPYTVHIQNVMAQYAVWWNRGLFPRIDGSRSNSSGSRRKATTLADERILATLVLLHGRNYSAIADAVPGWTEDFVRVRLRNNRRKDLLNEPGAGPTSSIDIRACIKDTIQKALESVDGELTPEEHMTLLPHIVNEDDLTNDFWDNVATHHIPWRKPVLLKRMWLKASKEGQVTEDGIGDNDQKLLALFREKSAEYEMKLLDHATFMCAL